MIDPQNLIDRMLEVENLTDALEDQDADHLLAWGAAQIREAAQKLDDPDAAGEFANNLMGFMRSLNRIAGNPGDVQPDDLAQLAERSRKAFGPGREPAAQEYAETAAHLAAMTPRQVMDSLLAWLAPTENPPSASESVIHES